MARLAPGLKILEDLEGTGPPAKLHDNVVCTVRIRLNRGDEVPMGSRPFTTTLGKRRVIAGIERSLFGMRAGGYRRVRCSPHLAYGSRGVEGSIPPHALLDISIWVHEVNPFDTDGSDDSN